MYFKITSKIAKKINDVDALARESAKVAQSIYDASDNEAYVQTTVIDGEEATTLAYMSLRYELSGRLETTLADYYRRVGIDAVDSIIEPISVRHFVREIKVQSKFYEMDRANRKRVKPIGDTDAFNELLPNYNERHISTHDTILREKDAEVTGLSLRRDYTKELERMGSAQPTLAQGHPVHYLLVSHSGRDAYEVSCGLTYHLSERKRLAHKHLIEVNFDIRVPAFFAEIEPGYFSLKSILEKAAPGSAVFFTIDENFFSEMQRSMSDAIIDQLTQEILEARHQTLFYLWTTDKNGKATSRILEKLSDVSLVEISDNELTTDEALVEMQRLLSDKLMDPELAKDLLPKEKQSYRPIEITLAFNTWFDEHLRTNVYPQYSTVKPFAEQVTEEIQGSAYQELQAMIGLDEVKAMVDRFIASHHMYKRYQKLGMNVVQPSWHCAFLGAPGTAKTTVARLFGRILKENGILAVGDFVEVTRADLIERYIGWTARNVRKYVKAAKGSVLFVDECYSLVDGKEGLYGDEAIAELVAAMENNYDDVVIIFAGYKDKTEEFIARNPGLRSRINFKMTFEDYNAKELADIAQKMAKDRGFRLTAEARERVAKLMQDVLGQKDFGNGRYARNVIDQAIMNQGVRIYKSGMDQATDEDVQTLLAEDFPQPLSDTTESREAHRNPAKRFS